MCSICAGWFSHVKEVVMAWSIETDVRPGYLAIRILGHADARVSEEIVGAVFSEIRAHGCPRLLIDIRGVDGRLGVLDTFNLVSSYPGIAGVRAAIVDRPENRSWSDFYETVSVNRGYDNKVFTDIDKAIEWLTA
ncbi:MAG: hypothetical protein ABFD90_04675 [Phycisphaerales bacterium]